MANQGEEFSQVNKRIAEGKISREIDIDVLIGGNPAKEQMYGRLEAYLQTGVVIDPDDLIKVVHQYDFTPDELQNLILISKIGIMEGLIQEPDNVPNMGYRTGCLAALAEKYFDITKNNNK